MLYLYFMSALTFETLSAEVTQILAEQSGTPPKTAVRCTLGRNKVMVLVEYPLDSAQAEPMAAKTLDWLEQYLRQHFDTTGLPEEAADLVNAGAEVAVQMFLKHQSENKPFTMRSFVWKVDDGFDDLFGQLAESSFAKLPEVSASEVSPEETSFKETSDKEPVHHVPVFQNPADIEFTLPFEMVSAESEAESEAPEAALFGEPNSVSDFELELELDLAGELEDALADELVHDLDRDLEDLEEDALLSASTASDQFSLESVASESLASSAEAESSWDLPDPTSENSSKFGELSEFDLPTVGLSQEVGADAALGFFDLTAEAANDSQMTEDTTYVDIFAEDASEAHPIEAVDGIEDPFAQADELESDTLEHDLAAALTDYDLVEEYAPENDLENDLDDDHAPTSADLSYGDLMPIGLAAESKAESKAFSKAESESDLVADTDAWESRTVLPIAPEAIADLSSDLDSDLDIDEQVNLFEPSEVEPEGLEPEDLETEDLETEDGTYESYEDQESYEDPEDYKDPEDYEDPEDYDDDPAYYLEGETEEDEDESFEDIASIDEGEVQRQRDQWQQQSQGSRWVFAGALGFVLVGALGLLLTRPCTVGGCDRIQTAQTQGDAALGSLDLNASLIEVTESKQQLKRAVQLLEPIPAWSPYYAKAQALLPDYRSQLTALDQITQAQTIAYQAAVKSQNPPHPLDTWQSIAADWLTAATTLEAVSPNSPVREFADRKLVEYRASRATILVRIDVEAKAEVSLRQAQQAASLGNQQADAAQSLTDWETVLASWELAVDSLSQIPQGTQAHGEAQKLLPDYLKRLEEMRDRTQQERSASRDLSKAQQLAAAAQQAESEDQWTLSSEGWKNALAQLATVASGTSTYKEAQPLTQLYTSYLTRAENNLQAALRFQPYEPQLYSACSAAALPKCTYSLRDGKVKLTLVQGYDSVIDQSITPPDQRPSTIPAAQFVSQSNQLLQAITLLSTQAQVPVELYDAQGKFLARYRPDLNGFVR